MKILVLDTSILLHLVRGKQMAASIKDYLQQLENVQTVISVVSLAEAESVVKQIGNWGEDNSFPIKQFANDIEIGNIIKAFGQKINLKTLLNITLQTRLI